MASCSQVSGFICPLCLPENSNGKFSVARGMVEGSCEEETAGHTSHRDAPLHMIMLQFYRILRGSLDKGMPLFSLQKPKLGRGWGLRKQLPASQVWPASHLHSGKRAWSGSPGEAVPSLAVRCSPSRWYWLV